MNILFTVFVFDLRRSKVPKFSQIVESVLTPLLNITQHH